MASCVLSCATTALASPPSTLAVSYGATSNNEPKSSGVTRRYEMPTRTEEQSSSGSSPWLRTETGRKRRSVEALAGDELGNRPSSQLRHVAHRFAQRRNR